MDYAKVFLGWTKEITLFLQGLEDGDGENRYGLTDKQRTEVMTLGINVIENEKVLEIVGGSKANAIKGIMTQSNRFYKDDILFYHFEKIIQN